MTALALIASKLSKLLPLLSSDKDGEVVATARAIGRLLSSAGADWHDLAAVLERRDRPPPVSFDFGDPPQADITELLRVVTALRLRWRELSVAESDFLRSMFQRLTAGRMASERQIKWILDIDRRLRRRRAA